MAGSWTHATTDDGKLLRNEDIGKTLENGGDWYEFAEEAYGMVWWLARCIGEELGEDEDDIRHLTRHHVRLARRYYQDGLRESPGTDGLLEEKN